MQEKKPPGFRRRNPQILSRPTRLKQVHQAVVPEVHDLVVGQPLQGEKAARG
jgi:hypothetical protein